MLLLWASVESQAVAAVLSEGTPGEGRSIYQGRAGVYTRGGQEYLPGEGRRGCTPLENIFHLDDILHLLEQNVNLS